MLLANAAKSFFPVFVFDEVSPLRALLVILCFLEKIQILEPRLNRKTKTKGYVERLS